MDLLSDTSRAPFRIHKSPVTMLTHRTARVCVENHCKQSLESGFVLHKYSSYYKEALSFGKVEPGARSPEFTVSYDTGRGTTGVDWFDVGLSTYGRDFVINPENGCEYFDFLKESGLTYGAAVAGIIAAAYAGPDAGGVIKVVAQRAIDLLLNQAGTDGFKCHVLRDGDEDKLTIIKIFNDMRVEFCSVCNQYDHCKLRFAK